MKSIYSIKNPIAVRVPLGSIDMYEKLFSDGNLLDVEGGLKEAILVASNDLYNSLNKSERDKKYGDIKRAVLKYRIRNMTRCTPYGLFAGINLENHAQKTNLIFDDKHIMKRARVDMKWLFNYIDQLLQKPDILCNMRMKRNKLCYKSGDRFINPYFSAGGNAKGDESIYFSIRYTKPVQFVLNLSNEYICYSELMNQLVMEFEISEERAKDFLKELIHNEFLLMEIFPPLINTDAMDYLIHLLKNCMGNCNQIQYLLKLKHNIEGYNSLPVGEGIQKYLEIIRYMKEKVEAKDYLQIDTKINFKNHGISSTIGDEIERFVNLIAKLAVGDSQQEYISAYKRDFLEKYGYNIEVPILEMLDDNTGIGTPANYKNSHRNFIAFSTHNKGVEQLNHIIINRGINAIEKNVGIVELYEADFDKVCKDKSIDYDSLLNSVDIFAQVLSSDANSIDDGDFSLQLSGCISSAGGLNSLGRFSDLFWDEKAYDKEMIAQEEELLGKDYVIAELVEKFRSGRTANVDMNINSLKYQICIGCNGSDQKENIDIDDIYIGVDVGTGQFYAKSHRLNKRIYARTTHMLNNLFGSNPYRFLRDISSLAAKFHFGEIIAAIGANTFEYFPRVICGKTIIRPARWRYERSKENNFNAWENAFMDWVKSHKVPDYVNYMTGDNFLRLDLRKKECRELLYFENLKYEILILNEDFADNSNLWLKDTNGNRRCCEMVFALNKNRFDSKSRMKPNLLVEKRLFYDEHERILFPGEKGWYFFKLYGMSGREDEFIGIDLKNIVSELMKEKLIDKHFFIRYLDLRPHVRVRFHVCDGMEARFNSVFQNWLIQEREKGIVTDLNIAVYEREIERYGGLKLISLAESLFTADSIFVESLRESLYAGELSLSDECIAIWSINGLINDFGKELEEAEKWMSLSVKKNEYRDVFKKNEKEYRNCLSLRKATVPLNVIDAYNFRSKMAHSFYCEIIKNGKQEVLSNTDEDILSSLIHMFCNRFMADNTWEKKVRALTRHTLYATLSYRQYHKNDMHFNVDL